MKTLSLATLLERLIADDFGEIVRMPAPENLRVYWNAVGWVAGPVLPNVTHLRLNSFTGTEDLSKVPELFPNLRTATIHLAPDVDAVPERVLGLLSVPVAVEMSDSVL
ncbi:hypothetical protein [Streptomyces ossamyceticus]|uniref:hypothetical protein n=1 Tax=Streptomyces ossamyceticus TaxID=249581 RepID=UPI0006E249C9|nr:hypothetical protein [Streptomyces ossamyceticus]